jgi:murein L,D-transpeptidase YcbB/YkuD
MRPEESFVAQPIRSLQTMLRIIAEDNPTHPTVIPDGVYDQETITAVSTFQRRHGLPVTGVADENTWNAIVAAYDDALVRVGKAQPIEIIMDAGKVFRRGEFSPYLYLLQSMLLYLPQLHPSIDTPTHNGTLDSPTAEALAGFQLLAGLPPTGELDKLTWKYLVNQFTLNANRMDQQR